MGNYKIFLHAVCFVAYLKSNWLYLAVNMMLLNFV